MIDDTQPGDNPLDDRCINAGNQKCNHLAGDNTLDEILERFYRDYETDMAAVVPPIGLITDIKEQQRQSEHFWNKRMKEAKAAIQRYALSVAREELKLLDDVDDDLVLLTDEGLQYLISRAAELDTRIAGKNTKEETKS